MRMRKHIYRLDLLYSEQSCSLQQSHISSHCGRITRYITQTVGVIFLHLNKKLYHIWMHSFSWGIYNYYISSDKKVRLYHSLLNNFLSFPYIVITTVCKMIDLGIVCRILNSCWDDFYSLYSFTLS